MMIRSFLPVGQGAFYRETFDFFGERINVIYDCGSYTSKEIVESKIREDFSKDETIHAVFISHFDEDHINGLPFLLNYCNVKNLFIPLLTSRDLILLKLKNLVQKNNFTYQFLDNPRSFLNGHSTTLFSIIPYEYEGKNELNGWDEERIESGNNISNIIFPNKLCKEHIVNWEYIPFNFKRDDRIIELENALKSEFSGNDSVINGQWGNFLDDVLNNYEDYKDKLIQAFKKVKGSFNTNSLVLFSGIKQINIRQKVCQLYSPSQSMHCSINCYKRFCFCHNNYVNGCLFMGDYDASGSQKWEELYNAYKGYLSFIGCIQIPHHGSLRNYNFQLSHINSYKVISAGTKNKYNHPHSGVIKDLLLNHNQVFIVTEDRDSEVDIICNY